MKQHSYLPNSANQFRVFEFTKFDSDEERLEELKKISTNSTGDFSDSSSQLNPISILELKQVHGPKIWRTSELRSNLEKSDVGIFKQSQVNVPSQTQENVLQVAEGDGWILDSHSIAGIRTADCMCVLVYSKTTSFVALLHAGWRGVKAGIVESAIEFYLEQSRENNVEDVVLEIFPSIHQESYEVGPEFLEYFGADASFREHPVFLPSNRKEHYLFSMHFALFTSLDRKFGIKKLILQNSEKTFSEKSDPEKSEKIFESSQGLEIFWRNTDTFISEEYYSARRADVKRNYFYLVRSI